MTNAPPRVRAVARVQADAALSTGPAMLAPRRRPGHLGAVHVLQLVLVEAVALSVLAVASRGMLLLAGGVAVGLLIVFGTLARRRGRWWLERMLLARRYRQRRRAVPDPHEPDPRLAALRCLASDLVVTNVNGPDGAQIGIAQDGAGWFAVASVGGPGGMRGDAEVGLPLDSLAEVLRDAGQPGAVLQVVTHTVPAPSVELDPRWPCDASYRDLLNLAGPVPADRITWVAVRLDARTLAEAEVGGLDESAKAPAVAAALVRRMGKALRRAGLPHQVLGAEALIDALARSCDLSAVTAAHGPATPREEWRSWRSGGLAHATYWLQGWPDLTRGRALLDSLTVAPASLTSVSMVLAADESGVDLQCLARVAAPDDRLGAACQAVTAAVKSAGGRVFRLDGEQAPAVYATAPTGGGVR